MRLLIVNPNTSKGVTSRIRKAAEAAALPGDVFTTVSAAFGPELIVTDEDTNLAVQGVKEVVRAHDQAFDGIILASFGDTGAQEVRHLRAGTPVIGIGSAAFSAARALGGSFGIVTFGDSVAPALTCRAEEMGLADALVGIATVEGGDLGDPGTVQARLRDVLRTKCQELVEQGASSIVVGGGPLAGFARTIGPTIPVPLIDGTQAAVGLMRAVTDNEISAGLRGRSVPKDEEREKSSGGV